MHEAAAAFRTAPRGAIETNAMEALLDLILTDLPADEFVYGLRVTVSNGLRGVSSRVAFISLEKTCGERQIYNGLLRDGVLTSITPATDTLKLSPRALQGLAGLVDLWNANFGRGTSDGEILKVRPVAGRAAATEPHVPLEGDELDAVAAELARSYQFEEPLRTSHTASQGSVIITSPREETVTLQPTENKHLFSGIVTKPGVEPTHFFATANQLRSWLPASAEPAE